MKCVRIQNFSGLYFPAFGLSTKRDSVSLRIQFECGKMQTRKTPDTDTFYTVLFLTIVLSAENYIHEKNQLQMYGKAQKATLVIFIKRTQEYSILSGQYIPAYGIRAVFTALSNN